MNPNSMAGELKVNEVAVLQRKYLFLVSSKGEEKYTLKSFLIALNQHHNEVVRGRLSPESVIHSDGWRGYNGLVDLGYKKNDRVHLGSNEFAKGKKHINSIESIWSFA